MSETKTIVIPSASETAGGGGANWMMGLLAPLLQQRGVDPGILSAMAMRNGNGFDASCFFWVFLLLILGQNGMFGFGRNGMGMGMGMPAMMGGLAGEQLASMINNDSGRQLLMSAIQNNGAGIDRLASTLNCDIKSISNSLCQLNGLVQSMGPQIVNAVQAGDASIVSKLDGCCCNLGQKITEQGYQNQLANCQQTNALTNAINSSTLAIKDGADIRHHELIARLDAMEKTALQGKIDALQETKSTLQTQIAMEHQTASLQGYTAQALIPLQQAVAQIQQEVNAIKAAQPPVATLPYSPAVAVPAGLAMQYGYASGLYGTGGGQTFWT